LPVKAGSHNLNLTKDGYRSWQKTLPVVRTEVSWIQYPFLVPLAIDTQSLGEVDQVSNWAQSQDGKLLAMVSSGPPPAMRLLEVGKQELKAVYQPSPEEQAQGVQIGTVTWSLDSEHLLLEVKLAGQSHWFVINALNPSEIIDLSKEFGASLSNLQFSAKNWRELYWLSPEGLRKLDIGSKTISAVLAANVNNFVVSEEAIFYVQTDAGAKQVVRLDRDNQTKILVANLAANDYGLVYIAYGDQHYVAVLDYASKSVSLYDSASESQKSLGRFDTVNATGMFMSPQDRFLIMQQDNQFAVYDFEFSKLYRFSLSAKPAAISWFDEFHMLATIDSQSLLLEFDGGNQEKLIEGISPQPVFASRNRELVYSFTPSSTAGKVTLQASRLKR
ncbi:hypothetical protein HY441_01760, partial [Candidatus Microgenomates bacterium]|nr:hypothetical protein [Candidatus Microgenomates bacterium]